APMTTFTGVGPARAALSALVDYAGLFPPAALGMADAVAEYDAARRGPYAWMLGRFIVPASRLAELEGTIAGRQRFSVSAIVDADPDPRRWFGAAQRRLTEIAGFRERDALRIETLEAALPRLLSARDTFDAPVGQFAGLLSRAGLHDLPAYVELPRDERWPALLAGAMAAAARSRLGVKIRCGGAEPSAYPSVAEVAAFVDAAATEHVPFKATAGLHHPIRHWNASAGTAMHGFLNLLAAAVFGHRLDLEAIEAIVAEEDAGAFSLGPRGFAWRGDEADEEEIALARAQDFVAYGSCSFDEPVEDLIALHILERA
ncbi:MAG TPA: hypothetical protein VMH02_03990, partial [Verrucomicrobiae bacterium]|nr:hypothetical protein [Verrucomicrobiae bacterium]